MAKQEEATKAIFDTLEAASAAVEGRKRVWKCGVGDKTYFTVAQNATKAAAATFFELGGEAAAVGAKPMTPAALLEAFNKFSEEQKEELLSHLKPGKKK